MLFKMRKEFFTSYFSAGKAAGAAPTSEGSRGPPGKMPESKVADIMLVGLLTQGRKGKATTTPSQQTRAASSTRFDSLP